MAALIIDSADDHISRILSSIRVIPDFSKPGIMFQDITTLLLDPKTFKDAIDLFVERYKDKNINVVVGEVILEEYSLEYGTYIMEMHVGAVQAGERGHKKTTHRRDIVSTYGVNWDDAVAAVLNGSNVVFRVDSAEKVKLKRLFSCSRMKSLVVGGDVEIDGSDNKFRQKTIKLKSRGGDKPKLQLEAGGYLIIPF
ncbi:Pribosyltran domain-containing protein [Abeliophyllum distichum]|uniref:adenine phosphoribosyltransferase n=1 Tax=Abeliophyllum distichum TaxID=126358 RepID=A0ABD1TDF0_9LAMI